MFKSILLGIVIGFSCTSLAKSTKSDKPTLQIQAVHGKVVVEFYEDMVIVKASDRMNIIPIGSTVVINSKERHNEHRN